MAVERGARRVDGRRARRRAVRLRHPGARQGARPHARDAGREVRRQNEFDFEYGDEFGDHIEKFDLLVLQGARPLQPGRRRRDERAPARALKELADWLHANDRKFLFELLVPADRTPAGRGRRRHRPLRRRAAPGADAPRDRGTSRTPASRSTSGRSRASTPARTPRCSPSRPARAKAARTSSACSWAAAPATRRSTTGSSRPRRSRASSASRSAARSGGTR